MDADTFDALVKRLTATPVARRATPGSRRTLLRLVTALPLTGTLVSLLHDEGEAAGRRKRRKKHHQHHAGDDKRNRKGKHKGKDKNVRPTPAPASPPPPACTPTTCAAQSTNCGTIPDGCGTQIRCGPDACGDGYTCTANRCRCPDGTAVCEGSCCHAGQVCQHGTGPCCTPVNPCGATSCGVVTDNCGGGVDCGDCSAPDTCGGGNPGTPHVCGCTDSTCPVDANCGTIPNGCGGTVSCGGPCSGTTPICSSGNVCVGCSPTNACPAGGCCASSGACVASGAPCDDGDPCTSGETCTSGICGGGSSICTTPPECRTTVGATCSGGDCTYPPVGAGTPCPSRPCGECDGTGTCVSRECGSGLSAICCGAGTTCCGTSSAPVCCDAATQACLSNGTCAVRCSFGSSCPCGLCFGGPEGSYCTTGSAGCGCTAGSCAQGQFCASDTCSPDDGCVTACVP